MQNQTGVYIPKPCHEDWHKMTPTQQGKFCGSCSKQVIDFSLMNDNQILNVISNQSGKLCGRFDADQLQRPLIETKIKKKKNWWMAAFMPLFLINNKSHNDKNIMLNTDTTVHQFEDTFVTMGLILEEPKRYTTVTGKVSDEAGNPLSYVTIIEKDMQNRTVTDSSGNFSININSDVNNVTLVASYVGYETIERQIALSNNDRIYIDMHLAEDTTTGLTEIVVGKIGVYNSLTNIDTVKTAIKKICGVAAFKMYPNPAIRGNQIQLEIKQAGQYELQLFDNQSRLITVENISTNSNKSNTGFPVPANISAGNYYLRLINKQTKKSYTEKLIIH